MKRLPNTEEQAIDPIGLRIWEEIVYSMDQYTNDSVLSKFYLPESLLEHCRKASFIFAQLLYTPIPSTEEVKRTRLCGLLYLAMACGVQIYLKERSISKQYTPYRVVTDEQTIRLARNRVSRALTEGIKVQPPISQVLDLIITNLHSDQYIKRFTLKGKEFNSEKFDSLLPAVIMWGYLFAKELITDEN
ncbi:MAG: hypothetical protein KatS3mg089_0151 [Patescibacteria group bacterium]|nr:MAG: hypothetical protein KatS3mg089_0151 [Patescibacteria group bacterium]